MSRVLHRVQLPEPGTAKEYILTYGFVTRHVGYQKSQPMLWFEAVVEEQRCSKIEVICVGTGWPIQDNYWYVGTLPELTKPFVWHYYAKYIND